MPRAPSVVDDRAPQDFLRHSLSRLQGNLPTVCNDAMTLVALCLVLLAFVYLVYAMLRPERF
ncbi:potassium-transporting ATPase subunit F [Luteitalea pratensis]|uniref:potassium-transporting ATPase subunit F n=1 Tax=Luteitalea pratensis TaxID=1855912 RepID=UPI000D72BEA7